MSHRFSYHCKKLLSGLRFRSADRCFECRGVLKGGVWNWYELAQALASGEEDGTRLYQLPI